MENQAGFFVDRGWSRASHPAVRRDPEERLLASELLDHPFLALAEIDESTWIRQYSSYCWWFRNPANQLIGGLSHHLLYRVLYIPGGGGGLKDFWNFHPELWGNDPNWHIFFRMGWKPPTCETMNNFLNKRVPPNHNNPKDVRKSKNWHWKICKITCFFREGHVFFSAKRGMNGKRYLEKLCFALKIFQNPPKKWVERLVFFGRPRLRSKGWFLG